MISDILQGKMSASIQNYLPFKVVTVSLADGSKLQKLVRNPDYRFSEGKPVGRGDQGESGGKGTGKFNDPIKTKTNKGVEVEFG